MEKLKSSPSRMGKIKDPLVVLYLKAFGKPEASDGYKLVHSGCIKKIPPKGWENYTPSLEKKARYMDSSEPLTGSAYSSSHDLEDK